jgi:hypothetical protein
MTACEGLRIAIARVELIEGCAVHGEPDFGYVEIEWRGQLGTRGRAMRARITIEYFIPDGDLIALRDREEQRWMRSETLLALQSATVKVEWVDEAKAS